MVGDRLVRRDLLVCDDERRRVVVARVHPAVGQRDVDYEVVGELRQFIAHALPGEIYILLVALDDSRLPQGAADQLLSEGCQPGLCTRTGGWPRGVDGP